MSDELECLRADNARLRQYIKVAKRHLTTATNAKSENSCRTEADAARELMFDALEVTDSREWLRELLMRAAEAGRVAQVERIGVALMREEWDAVLAAIVDGVMK
jgi:hypothetical protein